MSAATAPRAAIAGVWEGALDARGKPCRELAIAAAQGALADAGLELADVDGLLATYAWEEPSLMFAAEIADGLALEPAYAETVCFGGAGPVLMVARAARAIALGLCDVAVGVAVSNRASALGRAGAIAALRDVLSAEFEIPYGAFVPPMYALCATRHMEERGIAGEELAAVATAQRAHAARHPRAAMREPIGVADVLASPLVSSPLHLLDCCLVTDFQAAVVLVGPERAARSQAAVPVLGTGEAHGRLSTAEAPSLFARGAGRSAYQALREAGVEVADLDFAELYDSFTITVLATIEEIGMSAPGDAGRDAARGDFGVGGRLPVNTNGGMLSYRTGGLSHVVEAVEQLRGAPRGVAVENAELGFVNGIGGVISAHGSLVLGRAG